MDKFRLRWSFVLHLFCFLRPLFNLVLWEISLRCLAAVSALWFLTSVLLINFRFGRVWLTFVSLIGLNFYTNLLSWIEAELFRLLSYACCWSPSNPATHLFIFFCMFNYCLWAYPKLICVWSTLFYFCRCFDKLSEDESVFFIIEMDCLRGLLMSLSRRYRFGILSL